MGMHNHTIAYIATTYNNKNMEGIANSSSQSTTHSGSTPAEYFRPEPKLGSIPNIPTIDLGSDDQDSLVLFVAAAAMEWGIFQVVNHGIPNELIEKLQAVGKEFFELPQEVKEAYAKPLGAKTIEGYGTNIPKDNIGKKSWVEFLFHLIWPSSKINYNFWPTNNASYREVTEEYAKHIREVGDKLFKCLSLGLGLEEHALKEAGGGDELEYMMKINHYPPCPRRRPESTFGVVAHTDLSTLTILVPNEIPGLQVLKDDKWIDAIHIPHALIFHIGDQIEIMSNGRYKSVVHRTTVDEKSTRMSWPVFLEPPEELEVGPLPELVDQDDPPKYKTKKFKDYRYCKLNKLPQ